MSILYVVATPEEAAGFPEPPLLTSIGTVNAAYVLTRHLAENPGRYSHIINAGTVGSLSDDCQPGHCFEIDHVFQHDFDEELIGQIVGRDWPNGFDLEIYTDLPRACLATGDAFINDSAQRRAIAHRGAHLVDMEGYAIAKVARNFGIPVTLIKQVSDGADEHAAAQWQDSASSGAHSLAQVVGDVARRVG